MKAAVVVLLVALILTAGVDARLKLRRRDAPAESSAPAASGAAESSAPAPAASATAAAESSAAAASGATAAASTAAAESSAPAASGAAAPASTAAAESSAPAASGAAAPASTAAAESSAPAASAAAESSAPAASGAAAPASTAAAESSAPAASGAAAPASTAAASESSAPAASGAAAPASTAAASESSAPAASGAAAPASTAAASESSAPAASGAAAPASTAAASTAASESSAPASSASSSATVSYEQGGSDWTGTCATGQNQSPIDIPANLNATEGNLRFEYQSARGLNITNTGYGVQITAEGKLGRVKVLRSFNDTGVYDLTHIDMHCPSEHTKNGQQYDCELQFFHQGASASDNLAIAVLLSRSGCLSDDGCSCSGCACGSTHFFDSLFAHPGVPAQAGASIKVKATIAPSEFIKSHMRHYFAYNGSLTTPSCDETVHWYVANGVATIPDSVYNLLNGMWSRNKSFSASGHGNNRSVKPLGSRTVSKFHYTRPFEVQAKAVHHLAPSQDECSLIHF